MALAQHTAKKLLSYHAVSQVGYMVLGVATGNIIGIAGGIFHMLNNAIYKAGLFLGTGVVEKGEGTDHLEKLGGLAKTYPFTFAAMLISAFAISGIPPLNGFYSKWLIYQGVLNSIGRHFPFIIILCLVAALFGSALTLASFVKLTHAIFLGVKSKRQETGGRKREKLSFVFPQIVLAVFCVAGGIFAKDLFVKPVFGEIATTGYWMPKTASILIAAGIVLGLLIYVISNVKIRRSKTFIGGENLSEKMEISGVEFYTSIENIHPFKEIYFLAEKKLFDIYEIVKSVVFYFSDLLSYLHNGVLNNYLSWILGGLIFIIIIAL